MITISDSPAGETSRFTIEEVGEDDAVANRLPATVADPWTADTRHGEASHNAFCVLIVANLCEFVRGLSRLLQTCGHVVQCASTGAEALELASAFRPEFALVDVSLPDLSGYEVAALLQGLSRSAGLRIVSMSCHDDNEDRHLSRAAGCVDHLHKPVDVADVKALLSGHHANVG